MSGILDRWPGANAVRRQLYLILENSHPKDWLNWVVQWPLIALILANVVAVSLETVPSISAAHGPAFAVFEAISVGIFTLEYAARLWACVEHPAPGARSAAAQRLRFAIGPFAVIDLLAILPSYLSLLLPGLVDLRMLRAFRLLRLLKLARHSPALATLWRVLVDERRALAAALLIMMVLLTLAATAMYYAERHAQPEIFSSIPAAMWWGIATLTTVGYGDIVPVTTFGRVIAGLTMILGLGMFALPVGIIASGFSSEIHRRDFVVTWGMVARVPLFRNLDALSVSRITNLLRARAVPAGTVVCRRGEESDAMYFIASGTVEVKATPESVSLGEGDFFGELALLRRSRRNATVRTVTSCRLLVLDSGDFHELMESDGDFRQAIESVAEERLLVDKNEPAQT